MAGTLKRKLIYTVTRPQIYATPCCSSTLSRSISQSPQPQTSQTFTFGTEVDALIAPHIEKLSKRPQPRSRPPKPHIPPTLIPSEPLPPSRAEALDTTLAQITTHAQTHTHTQTQTHTRRRPKLSEIPPDRYPSHTLTEPIPFAPTPTPTPLPATATARPEKKARANWQIQKAALQAKFGNQGWAPRKKLSPDAMDGIRAFHAQDPVKYSTPVLAQQFKVSPEAIRRILKSKWMTEGKKEERRERWARRHDRVWDQRAALGLLPERTRTKSVGGGDEWEEELAREQVLEEARAEAV